MVAVGCSGPVPVVHPSTQDPSLKYLLTAASTTSAILSDSTVDTTAETANGAIDLHGISIRLVVVLRCVGTQSRSIDRMLVPREIFWTISRMRATAEKTCVGPGSLKDRMTNHAMQDTRTRTRSRTTVMRRTWRRNGVQSTQRPRALANKSTHMVFATPLRCKVDSDVHTFTILENDNAYWIDEGIRLPGEDAWMNRIQILVTSTPRDLAFWL